MKVKEESEKVDFKLNIQNTKLVASSLITQRQKKKKKKWGNNGNSEDFISWAPKITADGTTALKLKDAAP